MKTNLTRAASPIISASGASARSVGRSAEFDRLARSGSGRKYSKTVLEVRKYESTFVLPYVTSVRVRKYSRILSYESTKVLQEVLSYFRSYNVLSYESITFESTFVRKYLSTFESTFVRKYLYFLWKYEGTQLHSTQLHIQYTYCTCNALYTYSTYVYCTRTRTFCYHIRIHVRRYNLYFRT